MELRAAPCERIQVVPALGAEQEREQFGALAARMKISGRELLQLKARPLDQLAELGSRVFAIMPAVGTVSRIRIVHVQPTRQPGDVLPARDVRSGDQEPSARLEHAMDLCEHGDRIANEMLQDLAIDHSVEVPFSVRKLVLLDVELAIAEFVALACPAIVHGLDVLAASTEEIRQLKLVAPEALEEHGEEVWVGAELEHPAAALGNELQQPPETVFQVPAELGGRLGVDQGMRELFLEPFLTAGQSWRDPNTSIHHRRVYTRITIGEREVESMTAAIHIAVYPMARTLREARRWTATKSSRNGR